MSDDTGGESWSTEHYGFETEPVAEPAGAPLRTRPPVRATQRRLLAGSVLALVVVVGSGGFAAAYAATHDAHHRGPHSTRVVDDGRPAEQRRGR